MCKHCYRALFRYCNYKLFARTYCIRLVVNVSQKCRVYSQHCRLGAGGLAWIWVREPGSRKAGSGEHPDGLGPFLRCYYTGPVTPQEWSNLWPRTCNSHMFLKPVITIETTIIILMVRKDDWLLQQSVNMFLLKLTKTNLTANQRVHQNVCEIYYSTISLTWDMIGEY